MCQRRDGRHKSLTGQDFVVNRERILGELWKDLESFRSSGEVRVDRL